ncbi:Rrf2 family transcriptional regulator [Psychromonas sp. Urea-02u-13]|uniref:Rrf2 family transcriptional regulator n=1 Tax=Psychromonas sp. Urea-02u-13 TaxID=2058326 RepID=UPI000C32C2A6|nr:Rrf2 family transcriptional regulator [Psychromonas sp. Urea-02u-13]PKG37229.1 transcriptional repressor NsrR [Psychromonas sp. Urea-02u-13]
MRLTTYTDSGLRALIYLASLPKEQLSSVAEVAAVYQLSYNNLAKIVGHLKKIGYVRALQGKNGGIQLALTADKINIGEVISHLENHLDGVDCASTACKLQSVCRLQQALILAMHAFIGVMNEYTLADLISNKEQLMPLLIASTEV